MMTATDLLLIVQAVASGAMCGVIWFVQLVHYPLFTHAHGDERRFAIENQARTGRLVIPLMLAEGVAAAIFAWSPPPGVPRSTVALGLFAVVALWASTGFVQMPLHARLARDGHAPALVSALVRTNWLRTALWTFRACLSCWMLRAVA